MGILEIQARQKLFGAACYAFESRPLAPTTYAGIPEAGAHPYGFDACFKDDDGLMHATRGSRDRANYDRLLRTLEEKPVILKSETCACYRDDDGLHPCYVLASQRDQYWMVASHIQKAFGLEFAPEPPKRAVRVSRTLWRAPCGCEIVFDGDVAAIAVNSCNASRNMPSAPELRNHIARAVAAVMREQTPPMPSEEEMHAAVYVWSRRHEEYTTIRDREVWFAAIKWDHERKP